MTALPIAIVLAQNADGPRNYVTVAPPGAVFERGLINEAIVGVLTRPLAADEAITSENFARNAGFVAFLNEIIANYGPQQADLQAEARRIVDGHVVVVDLRTRDRRAAPPEDIFGAFEVKDGVVGPFLPSPNHRILTENGFCQLDAALTECLTREIAERMRPPPGASP